jgi:hypothetical protein
MGAEWMSTPTRLRPGNLSHVTTWSLLGPERAPLSTTRLISSQEIGARYPNWADVKRAEHSLVGS